MNFISYLKDGEEKFGISHDQKITDLTGKINGSNSLKELIFSNGLHEARKYAANHPGDLDIKFINLLPVIPNPSKIICVGLNYHDHVKETEKTVADNPVTFQRFNDSQAAHLENMIIPYASEKLDFEGEMALIMKESGSHIKEEDALNYVAGYSCYNDGSVRDWQRHTKSTFGMGKNFKKTGSFGPHMVLAEDIQDYKKLTLETVLNGEVMQSASLSQLIFDLPFLISYVSKALPWRAGDVLVTGTPGGVGFKRNPPIFLKEGDKVDIIISEIGTLSNTLQNEVL